MPVESRLYFGGEIHSVDDAAPHPEAVAVHQGRILAVLDRRPQAIAMYKKVLELDDTPLKLEVENRLAELEAKK